jgi:hypothetical protein
MSLTAWEQMLPVVGLSPEGEVRKMSIRTIGPDHLLDDWTILFEGHSQSVPAPE